MGIITDEHLYRVQIREWSVSSVRDELGEEPMDKVGVASGWG